jgi:hypothetical protein
MNRKSITLYLVLAIAFSSMLTIKVNNAQLVPNQAEDSWVNIVPYPPTYRGIGDAVAFNGSIYALAGTDTGQDIFKRYEPDKDAWIALTQPPIAGDNLVVCQNKIYLLGGGQSNYDGKKWTVSGQITQVYNPSTDQWENRSAMPNWIMDQTANAVDDKIYLISGLNPAAYGVWYPSEVTYVYDTTNDTWSTMAPIPTPVGAYASTVLDGKIYIIGGGPATDYHNLNATTLVQIFDPKINQWTFGTPIPKGVAWAGACSTSGYYAPERIYVVGGSTWYTNSRSSSLITGNNFNQVFDPQTGKWSSATPTLEDFSSLTLVNLNDALYAIKHGRPETAEKYIPTGYKANLLPTNIPINSPSPSSTDTAVQPLPFQAMEIVTILIIATIAIVSLLLFRRHRKTAKPS